MKERNRFGNLLKHLMAVAKLKNYTLAKELQYDESYISKWVTGSLLPTEKSRDKVFRDISRCVVASLDEDSRNLLFSEYQVDQNSDLEDAIYDNLEAEFDYVMNLKDSAGPEAAMKTLFFPELTLAQFLKRMRHPVLRQVKSLDVIMATDILSLDRHYQLSLAELENSTNVNVTQRSYPGVHFTMLINLDVPESNNVDNVEFLQNLLTNLANVDFNLYASHQTQGKILFSVRDAYSISGMIMDENHCLAVTATEEVKNCNALYDRLQSLCNQETLIVRRTSAERLLASNEYMQYSFSRNQRWCMSMVTEQFIPDDIFEELAGKFCARHPNVDREKLSRIHKLSSSVMESVKLRMLLNENGLNEFAVTGMMDFFGDKMYLNPEQRLKCLEYAAHLPERNPHLDFRMLRSGNKSELNHIPHPTLFLSDVQCYMRILRSGPVNNLSMLNSQQVCNMFCAYFDEIWADKAYVDADYNSAVEIMRYAKQMVKVQIRIGS